MTQNCHNKFGVGFSFSTYLTNSVFFYSLRSRLPSLHAGVDGGEGNKRNSFWRSFLQINQFLPYFYPQILMKSQIRKCDSDFISKYSSYRSTLHFTPLENNLILFNICYMLKIILQIKP